MSTAPGSNAYSKTPAAAGTSTLTPPAPPKAVVYFTNLDPAQASAFWGFYARPDAPAGTGLHILFEALDLAFSELALHKLNGEVLADNSRSVHLHKKVGFTEEGRFRQRNYSGHPSRVMLAA